MTLGEATKILVERREFLGKKMLHKKCSPGAASYMKQEVLAIDYFLEGKEAKMREAILRRNDRLTEELAEAKKSAQVQTAAAREARKKLQEFQDLQGYK